ncbi:ATP-dependent Clp protease proteolytic subunit [Tissierella sp. MSJ-40]|uniref:ATP-dependent Clp protease proteolytic subunit n=1 Tax=Tissierella simiarum TaxID=2841534 RepID=A0ABS6E602_9FIRM|nr:ATP-dependent Clp protease proteolytic subunit [Tissierella simiarum]MBU5437649.1 ATP-dependent Clp protease proteolytic subunit [Tissierella simiarum]
MNIKEDIENTKNIEEKESLESIKEMGTPNTPEFKNDIQFLTIIGEVEGHTLSPSDKKTTKYEHIIPMLIAAEQDPKIKGIFIILNTVGGDVEAGLALSEMINSVTKPKVSLVLGGGHSIGVPLATSTDYSFIVPTATMTIHPIRTTGLVIGVPQTFRYFQKMQQRIIDFILRTSDIDKKSLLELMYATDELANDVGTILIGKEAVEYGLINEVGGFNKALKKLHELIPDK